jgi:hypothetical protein
MQDGDWAANIILTENIPSKPLGATHGAGDPFADLEALFGPAPAVASEAQVLNYEWAPGVVRVGGGSTHDISDAVDLFAALRFS